MNDLKVLNNVFTITFVIYCATSIALVIYEYIWSKMNKKKIYSAKSVICNLSIMVFLHLVPNIVVTKFLCDLIYPYRLWTLPDSYWTVLALIPLADLCVYWSHRAEHKFGLLWASHMVHHSDQELNYSVHFRVHWMHGVVQSFFHLPLILIGFPVQYVLFGKLFNYWYQFWTHTQSIGKLGFLEGWISTPSAHRVHHSCNDIYIDKNFATMFTFWDRVFGTYQPETEKCKFGIKEGFVGYNPLKLYIMPYVNWFNQKFKAKNNSI